MAVVVKTKEKADLFARFTPELFDQFVKHQNGNDPVSSWQRSSYERALSAKTPSNRDEDFKYVNFRLLNLQGLHPVAGHWAQADGNGSSILTLGLDSLSNLPEEYLLEGDHRNPSSGTFFGRFRDALASEPDNVGALLSLFREKFPERKFADFAHAFLSEGALLRVGKDVEEPDPRQIFTHIRGQSSLTSLSTFVLVEENAHASLIWDLASDTAASGLVNGTLDVWIRAGGDLKLLFTEHLAESLHSTMTVRVYLERDAQLELATINSGGLVNQMEIDVKFTGPGARMLFNGLYLGRTHEDFNLLTHQDHQVGNTVSDLYYIGTLSGASSSNYLGKITIEPQAQRSDAYQKNRNLILNKGCTVNSSPKLEISANDVRCSHGVTTSKVSDLEMFYLRSRGIDHSTARVLLADGFISQVTPRIKSPLLRECFARRQEALLYQWGGH